MKRAADIVPPHLQARLYARGHVVLHEQLVQGPQLPLQRERVIPTTAAAVFIQLDAHLGGKNAGLAVQPLPPICMTMLFGARFDPRSAPKVGSDAYSMIVFVFMARQSA
jgi:hypothetical protein